MIAVALLAALPSIVVMWSVLDKSAPTKQIANNFSSYNIKVVDARNCNLTLAQNEDAFAKMAVAWIEDGIDCDAIFEIKSDTLVLSKHITRLCLPEVEQIILPDTTITNPFFAKEKGFAVYVRPE